MEAEHLWGPADLSCLLGIVLIEALPDGLTRVVWDDGVERIYDLAR